MVVVEAWVEEAVVGGAVEDDDDEEVEPEVELLLVLSVVGGTVSVGLVLALGVLPLLLLDDSVV